MKRHGGAFGKAEAVEVYAAKSYDTDDESILALLDQDRRKQVNAFRSREERNRSISAGLLLRCAFLRRGYSQTQWQQVRIEKTTYGKPYLKGYTDFAYSLSHSGDWAVCAVDVKPVGIDIQEIRPWKIQVARRFYSEQEYHRLLSADRQTQEFFRMWTAKESAVKLSGRGIGAGIGHYIANSGYDYICDTKCCQEFAIKMYEELEGYIVCACSECRNFPDKLHVISLGNTGL